MPAHSGEIIGETAPRPVTKPRAQFFGIDFVMKVAGSTAKTVLLDARTRRARSALGKATHTDPQLLFRTAS